MFLLNDNTIPRGLGLGAERGKVLPLNEKWILARADPLGTPALSRRFVV